MFRQSVSEILGGRIPPGCEMGPKSPALLGLRRVTFCYGMTVLKVDRSYYVQNRVIDCAKILQKLAQQLNLVEHTLQEGKERKEKIVLT